jgi:hypothetical protein
MDKMVCGMTYWFCKGQATLVKSLGILPSLWRVRVSNALQWYEAHESEDICHGLHGGAYQLGAEGFDGFV